MKTPTSTYLALAATAALSGCGGGSTALPGAASAGAPGPAGAVRARAQQSWFAAGWSKAIAAGKDVLYLPENDLGAVAIYATNTKVPPNGPVGEITGFSRPVGVAVDSRKNLYVSDPIQGTVSIFKAGATSPFEVLSGLPAAEGVAVNAAGTLVVAGQNDLYVFAKGATAPTQTLHSSACTLLQLSYVAIDNAGNIFVPCSNADNQHFVGEYASGSTTLTALSVDSGGRPSAVRIAANGDLIVIDRDDFSIQTYPPGQSIASSSIGISVDQIALVKNDSAFYTALSDPYTSRYTYPAGGFDYNVADQTNAHSDVATSPASPLGTW